MKRVALVVGLMLAFAGEAALAQQADRIVLPKNVTPSHYDIAIVPDAKAETFTGSAKIDIDVHAATKSIELNAADLDFKHVALSGVKAPPKVSFDKAEETATLTFPVTLVPGHYVLAIDYTGKINNNAAGLFYLDYDTARGTKRALFTQFENSDARRFVPSWDEPAQKATFTLTATVPADEMAVSNMPIKTSEKLAGDLERVHFAQSPKMSSYLLFFGLGDFERIHKMVNGVDVGVITKRGDTAKGRFALDAAAHILPFYENYFGVKYPLPKLDLIAGPGQSQFFGAMENWGAIFFFERDVLVDPKLSGQGDKEGVYVTIAHEMAHQWFGDLVTMDWWDGIWLNEGFASWMELKSSDHFHPDWHLWLEALGAKEGAMHMDSRKGTHPIIQPIHDVLQANEAFDTITYEKGMSVIRMLENYVGEDAFRDGVRAYIKKYQYGNTVTDDLWRELDKVSPRPITQVAHDFTLQSGIPLIRVSATASGIHLTQDTFASDDSGVSTRMWHVPVVEKVLGANGEWRGIVSRDKPADIAVPKDAIAIVNSGQAGYFRTLYDTTLSERLLAHYRDLSPADQLGLFNDDRALGFSGYAPLSSALAIAAKARAGMNPTVLRSIAGQIGSLVDLYRGLPGEASYKAWGLSVLKPIFATVGWTAKPGEDPNVTLLRGQLLGALGDLDDPDVVAEAKKRFAAFLKNPSSLSADQRSTVLDITASHADETIWNELHALAKSTKNSMAQRQFYIMLGYSHDPRLADKTLALAMTDEAPVTLRPSMMASVSGYFPEKAFDFAVAHADQINAMVEPDSRNEFVPRIAERSYDPAMIAKLKAYADKHIAPTARQEVVVASAAISYAAEIRSKRLPEIDAWLKMQKH